MYMKADNQALRLEKLMQKHHVHPEYELCFPPVAVKKSALKKLAAGDVFLLGLEKMEMLLLSKEDGCAKVILSSFGQSIGIQIVERVEETEKSSDSKKYKKVRISMGTLRSRVLESGHKIETAEMDMHNVTLYADDKKIALAKMVMVDDEIAVQIKEVKKI